jgi:hypothetical protein
MTETTKDKWPFTVFNLAIVCLFAGYLVGLFVGSKLR